MNSSHRNSKGIIQVKPEKLDSIPDSGQKHTPTSQIVLLGTLLLVVAGIVLVVHWPVLSAQALAFDDGQYLTENPLVQDPGWASAGRFLSEVLEPSTVRGYYQPLTMISLMADYAITRQTDDLLPYHRTNLCLHVMNTALVIVLLYMLFGQVWIAVLAGLLFGLHPLTIEPTVWVSERKTLLATFFTLWCLIFYVRYSRNGSLTAYMACMGTFVLALMSKPTSTPLPLLLLVLDYWPLRRLSWRSLAEKIPFFLICGISAGITVVSQARTAVVVEHTKYPALIPVILTYNIRFYLNKIFWPVNLTAHYPIPKPLILSNPVISAGFITSFVLIVVLFLSLRRTRALMAGFLFFFLGILPTMQIIGFSNVLVSNKHAYLPSVGLLLILMWFLSRLWSAASRTTRQVVRRVGTVIVVMILAGGEAFAARSYLARWKDTLTLYRYMQTLAPNAPLLSIGLARGLIEKGKTDEAIEAYRKELRINPNYYKALNNLGNLLAQKGEVTEAIKYLNKAVQVKPNDFGSHFNLGIMLTKEGKFDLAIEHFRRAVRLQPQNAIAHFNLGSVLLQQGHIEEAIGEYQTALKIDPLLEQARRALSAALAKKRAESLEKAVK